MQNACYAGFKSNKTQFRLDSVHICHMMLYTCHSLVYPVIHQLYFKSVFFIPLGKFLMLESAYMHIPYTRHAILESEFDKSLFRQ